MRVVRENDRSFDLSAAFIERGFQVSPAHGELDRNVPMVVLPINRSGPLLLTYGCDLAEWHCAAVGRAHENFLDASDAVAIRFLPPDDEVETLLPFEDLRDGLPPDRGLDDRADIADVQAITGANHAVRRDREIRLP